MMNEYEIRSLLKSEEINKVWMEIQQALPHLAFCLHLSEERTDTLLTSCMITYLPAVRF